MNNDIDIFALLKAKREAQKTVNEAYAVNTDHFTDAQIIAHDIDKRVALVASAKADIAYDNAISAASQTVKP